MRILLVPLDERPCNIKFPAMLALTGDVELLTPPPGMLADKKRPADIPALRGFVMDNAPHCDAAILSVDMLVYGGLVPSRLHQLSYEVASRRLSVFGELRRGNPRLVVYAFASIMRAPAYDSDDEEPDYYASNGRNLFRRAYLLDLEARQGLDEDQRRELDGMCIAPEIIEDYERRREVNLRIDEECVGLAARKIMDYLVLPQDDSSPYGYTAQAQERLRSAISRLGAYGGIAVYPGSDEVAMTLIARAVCAFNGTTPTVRAHYASVLGPQLVPLYEDRPMFESLKSHVRACGARLCEPDECADIELMVNAPGKHMQEASQAVTGRDITYDSYRDLSAFVGEIAHMLSSGRRVAVCDSAYANGGDPQLLSELDAAGALPGLISFAGWNTNCNTLGTALSQAVVAGRSSGAITHNLAYRVIEDTLYQTSVRWEVDALLADHGGSYQDVSPCEDWARAQARSRLQRSYDGLRMASAVPVSIGDLRFPWRRMFEIDMEMEGA